MLMSLLMPAASTTGPSLGAFVLGDTCFISALKRAPIWT